jgi:hypothetical protein
MSRAVDQDRLLTLTPWDCHVQGKMEKQVISTKGLRYVLGPLVAVREFAKTLRVQIAPPRTAAPANLIPFCAHMQLAAPKRRSLRPFSLLQQA